MRNCQIKFGNNVPRGSESISYYLFHNEIGDFLNMIDPKGSRYYSIPNDRYVFFFPACIVQCSCFLGGGGGGVGV